MSLALTVGAFVLVVVLVYKYIIDPIAISSLSKIPNAHFTAPISSKWISRQRAQGRETRTIFALHQKLGPAVRLGPNEVSVNSVDGLRTIYVGGFEKSSFYSDFYNYRTPNLTSMIDRRPHSVQKRMISHVYSKSYLWNSRDLQAISTSMIFDRILPLLNGIANNEPLEVLDLSHAIGMDFVAAYLFGLAKGTDFIRDVKTRRHWLDLYDVFKDQPIEIRAESEVERWGMDMCEKAEKAEKPASKSDTNPIVFEQLAKCLDDPNVPVGPSPPPKKLVVASEMLDHLIAGHETSGITLTYIMYEMSRHIDLQSKLRAELMTLSPSLLASSSNPAAPAPSAIDALPLLDAILNETLRIYAPAPAPQPRVTPIGPKPTTIEGYEIPGGVVVHCSAYSLHRHPETFPQPFDWKPERWTTADKAQSQEMHRWFWAFSSGGRMCLGSHFAIHEIKLVIAAIYTNFTTTIIDDDGIEQTDSFISRPKGNKLVLKFEKV